MTKSPFSLADSQGDSRATETFVGLIKLIEGLTPFTAPTPKEKVHILKEAISAVHDFVGLENLGVRSAQEEFQKKYVEQIGRKESDPVSIFNGEYVGLGTRLVPLYGCEPLSSLENRLVEFDPQDKTADKHTSQRVFSLYVTTGADPRIVSFESTAKIEGNIIGYTHNVFMSEADDEWLEKMMEKYPGLLDSCLLTLISSAQSAETRALERAKASRKALSAVTTICELARQKDIWVLADLPMKMSGMPGSRNDRNDRITRFQEIVRAAGNTSSERQSAILKLVHKKPPGYPNAILDLAKISNLSFDETMKIINNEPVEA